MIEPYRMAMNAEALMDVLAAPSGREHRNQDGGAKSGTTPT